jgi:hypothetical protein
VDYVLKVWVDLTALGQELDLGNVFRGLDCCGFNGAARLETMEFKGVESIRLKWYVILSGKSN